MAFRWKGMNTMNNHLGYISPYAVVAIDEPKSVVKLPSRLAIDDPDYFTGRSRTW